MNSDKLRAFVDKSAYFLRANGLYVVAGLCAASLGAAFLIPSNKDNAPIDLSAATPTPIIENMPDENKLALAVTPSATPEIIPQPTPAEAIAPAVTSAPVKQSNNTEAKPVSSTKAPAPVNGKIIFGYASDTLVYSKTLEQWTTHEGIDISANFGDDVKAIRPGKVISVYEDCLLGYVVKVEHENSYVSIYANLSEDGLINEGETVKTGDNLGKVGSSAMSEIALDSHIHFAIEHKGESVDPCAYILVED